MKKKLSSLLTDCSKACEQRAIANKLWAYLLGKYVRTYVRTWVLIIQRQEKQPSDNEQTNGAAAAAGVWLSLYTI